MDQANHYYYVGDQMLSEENGSRDEPLLLTFSRLPSGVRDQSPPHMHAFLEIFYFESGEGFLECEDQRIPLHAHDLLVVGAKTLHIQYSKTAEAPLVYYNLTVDRLRINGLPPNCLTSGGCFLHSFETDENDCYRIIQMLRRELETQAGQYAAKVYMLFQALMIDLARLMPTTAGSIAKQGRGFSNQALLSSVREYMELHYAENLTLEQLSKLAMMQKSYFLQQFKKRYGVSPVRYLNLIRMETAKLLLTETDKRVTEIASEVGFNHPAYFSEMFLKTVGISPTQYRKLISEQEEQYPGSLREVSMGQNVKQYPPF